MGLLDKTLKKARKVERPVRLLSFHSGWHVPSPDEAMLHPTVEAGTHAILVCSNCPRWFRYGIKINPRNMRCECGKKKTLSRHVRTQGLVPKCNQFRTKIINVDGDLRVGWCKKLKTWCPLERSSHLVSGECISHPRFKSFESARVLYHVIPETTLWLKKRDRELNKRATP